MSGKVKRGRRAVTHWKVVESFSPHAALVECRLETGRTHQIRVHLTELGFPLVGDPLYGDHERKARALAPKRPELAKACLALDHQLLHAFHLGFEHPATGKSLEFDSPLPAEFTTLLGLLRRP
jgi:23S rRNA pseudouridine1911/1915/1917 synthase